MQLDLEQGLETMFKECDIAFEATPSFRNPKLNISFGPGAMNLFLDAFLGITMANDLIGLDIHTKTKIYFNKNFTLNLQLFDQKVDMIHGFDIKTIAAKPFAPRIPDICFNVLGLPHFYKPFSKIPEMFNKALPMLEICNRRGSIAFNHEKLAQAVEGEEVTFVTQEKDESKVSNLLFLHYPIRTE